VLAEGRGANPTTVKSVVFYTVYSIAARIQGVIAY
jgi:hypothetical protein